jgi:hypothetical protein
MHTLPRIGPGLANLKAEGLSAGFPVSRNLALKRFRIYFMILRPARRWDMKRLAMEFLYKEYEACDFEFFANKVTPNAGFYCEFTSFAVEQNL